MNTLKTLAKILVIVLLLKGCHLMFKSSLPGEFVNKAYSMSVEKLVATETETKFILHTRKRMIGFWYPWISVSEFKEILPPGCAPGKVRLLNKNYSAEITLYPHPEGNRRILIAKKKDYFYEIILQLKSVSSAYEIQEVQIHRVAENTTDRRWEPFLGNIRGFSCARYNIEEKSSYRAGKCLVIKAPSLPGGFFWPVGLIYQPVQDKLPPEIIATDMKNLETIFRVTTTDVVRGHYKDGKSASESTLFVEVIDTRNKPFKIVDTRNFSGGYTPPKLSSRGYASPLPLQQAVDYMRSFYKE